MALRFFFTALLILFFFLFALLVSSALKIFPSLTPDAWQVYKFVGRKSMEKSHVFIPANHPDMHVCALQSLASHVRLTLD